MTMFKVFSTTTAQIGKNQIKSGVFLGRQLSTTTSICQEDQILFKKVSYGSKGHVAKLSFNNPSKANSLSIPLLQDLKQKVLDADRDPQLRAIVLEGVGKNFSSGVNINQMTQLKSPNDAKAFIRLLHEACDVFRTVSVPSIAAIRGACFGGSLEMVATCDMRIASPNSKFCMPETAIGLPSVIEAARLPQLIGWGKAKRFLYTAETIDSQTAYNWGLVEELSKTDADLEESVEKVVQMIVDNGPISIKLQKQLFNQWEVMNINDGVEAGVTAFERGFETDEPNRMLNEKLALLANKKK